MTSTRPVSDSSPSATPAAAADAVVSYRFNPVAEREFIGTFRTPKALLLLIAPALLTVVLVLLRWPTDSVLKPAGQTSLEVFGFFGYGLATVICLLTPVIPAVSIVKERIQGTLELLLHSPLSRLSLCLGKLLGSVFPLTLALLMTVPAAMACYSMGGISILYHFLPLYLVLLLIAGQIASMSLAISSFSKSIDSSVRASYAGMLLLVVGTMAPYQVFQGSDDALRVLVTDWLRHLSPLPAFTEILGHGSVGGQGIVSEIRSVPRYVLASSLFTLLMCLLTASRMHIRIFDESRASGVMTDDRGLLMRIGRRIFFLVDPQRRSRNIGSFTNPVMIKEFRCRRFGRASWILRLVAVSAVASITLTYLAATGVQNWSIETIGGLLILLQMALILLLGPGMSAGLMANEVESGSWTMLRMTPQSSLSIAIGKLLSVAWPMFLVLMATIPGYVVMIYLRPVLEQQVILVVASLMLASLFTVLSSAAIGAFFRKNSTATVCSYGVLTTLTAVTFLIWLGRGDPFGFPLVERALIINPVSSALSLMRTRGFEQFEIVPWNWYFLGTASALAAIVFWARIRRLRQPE